MKTIPGKDVLFCDKDGNYSLYSTEELLTRKLNSWTGWKCSAGIDVLHITADGNIYAGTCRVGGLLGNIFDTEVEFLTEWQTCTKKLCMCGSEMKNFKLNPNNSEQGSLSFPKNYTEEDMEASWVGPSSMEKLKHFPKIITWDLGRRCNYSCSYCPESTSNKFEAHKSFESLKLAVDSLVSRFCKNNQKAQWVFTGGEPTINPAYMDILKYIRTFHHIIHTQTNGSRDPSYYAELIEYSSIGISLHFEEYNEQKLLNNCEAVLKKRLVSEQAALNWFGIRPMIAPGGFEAALQLKEKLLSLPKEWGEFNAINMSLLYQKENGEQLLDYSKDELEKINLHQ